MSAREWLVNEWVDSSWLERLDAGANYIAIAAFIIVLICLVTNSYAIALVAQGIGVSAFIVYHPLRWASRRRTRHPS